LQSARTQDPAHPIDPGIAREDDNYSPSAGVDALAPFVQEEKISEVISVIKSGKEATVYCCRTHPNLARTAGPLVAAKVYRDREHRQFKNDAVYWQGVSVGKRREQLAFQKRTDFGRQVQAARWMGREYGTLQALHAAGADVPVPYATADDAILMEYLGDETGAARQLQHVILRQEEVEPLLERVLNNVALWLANHRVHADLSAFNILYWQGRIKVIDFPQAVDPRSNRNAWDLLYRDLSNVARYFTRYGVDVEPGWLTDDLRRQYQDPRYRR
jgi:RIO kinase 1